MSLLARLLLFLVVYRTAPFTVEAVAALESIVQAYRLRGNQADYLFAVEESRDHCARLWPRYVAFRFWRLHGSRFLRFIDNEVCRVWPWLWPLWLPQHITMERRVFLRFLQEKP